MPATDEELTWHQQLLAGGAAAKLIPDIIWQRYHAHLARRLEYRYPNMDPDLAADAVTDAIYNYVTIPEKYDPYGKSLYNYLLMCADGDIKNSLATLDRRAKHHVFLSRAIGFDDVVRNISIDDDPSANLLAVELRNQARALARNPTELTLIDLLLDGVRDTLPYAQVLGLEHLTTTEQQAEVNRAKDRLRARLRRKLGPEWKPR